MPEETGTGLMEKVRTRYIEMTSAFTDLFVMTIGLIVIGLGVVGVVDLVLVVSEMAASGRLYQPAGVLEMINTVLLLIIIVEIFRNILAYLRHMAVLPIIIDIAILAVARNIIGFHVAGRSGSHMMEALSYAVLLIGLAVIYYVVKIREPREELQDETEQTI